MSDDEKSHLLYPAVLVLTFFPYLCSFSSGFWARQDSGPDNLGGHVPPRPPPSNTPLDVTDRILHPLTGQVSDNLLTGTLTHLLTSSAWTYGRYGAMGGHHEIPARQNSGPDKIQPWKKVIVHCFYSFRHFF